MSARVPWALLFLLGGVALRIVTLPGPRPAALGQPDTPPSVSSVKAGYEKEDISARDMAFILSTIAVIVLLLVGGIFIFVDRMGASDRHRFAARHETPATLYAPPLPLLQVHARGYYVAYLHGQQVQLNQYGWKNAAHTLAHIPIQRAMALVVGQSLDAPQ